MEQRWSSENKKLEWDFDLTINDLSCKIIKSPIDISPQILAPLKGGYDKTSIINHLTKLAYENGFCCYTNRLKDDKQTNRSQKEISKIVDSRKERKFNFFSILA